MSLSDNVEERCRKLLVFLGKTFVQYLFCCCVSDHDSIDSKTVASTTSYFETASKTKLELGFPEALGVSFSDEVSVSIIRVVHNRKLSLGRGPMSTAV